MNSIKKNIAYNSIYQMLIIILPIITAPYISRILGPDGIGTYSYTNTIANYFILFAMLGLNNYGNRSIAFSKKHKRNLNKTFWEIYAMQVLTSISILILYSCYAIYVSNNKLISTVQILVVLSALFDINWFFFGMEEFKLIVTRNSVIKIFTVILIFIFVKSSNDFIKYILIMSISILYSQLILWNFLLKRIQFIKPKWQNIKNHFKSNLVLFIPVIAISLYKIMDKVMLGYMSSVIEVGYYTNSEQIISMPLGLITALGAVMLPRMSNLISHGKEKESHILIEKSMYCIMLLASAFMFGIAGISNVFIPIFLGIKFNTSIPIVSVLSFTIIFISWANVIRTQYLIPNKKDKIYIKTVFLGAVVNLILNTLLIPKLGALGASIGTLAAEITVCMTQTIMVWKNLNFKKYFKNGVWFLIFGFVMYLGVKALDYKIKHSLKLLILEILCGVIIYSFLVILYLIFTKNVMAKEIIKPIVALQQKIKFRSKYKKQTELDSKKIA